MSINTDSADKPIADTPQNPSDSGLSFLKNKWKLYLVIFLCIVALGKIISASASGELLSQDVRNIISVIGLFILLVAGLVNAELIYLIFILYIPFADALPGQFGARFTALNLFNVLSFFVILCWFVDKIKKDRIFFIANRLTKIITAFVFLCILSYVINGFTYGTDYLAYQIFNLKRWLDPVVLFFITSGMAYRRDLRRDALIAILLGVAMVTFLAIKDVSQISHFDYARRATGVGGQSNMLGAFAVDYMFLFFGILLVNFRKKFYWFATLPFWWCIKTVAVAFSRGAYLSFVICTFIISFIKSKALFVLCIIIFMIIATNLEILPTAVRERIEMTVTGEKIYTYEAELESSADKRIEAWKDILTMIKNKPFLGYGIGMVGTYLYYYTGTSLIDVHNSFLLLAAENGLITLLVFLLILFMGLRVCWFVYRHSQDGILKGGALGLFVGIIGVFINSFFGSHITTLWEIGYFWVLLAIFANEEKELRHEALLLQKT